MAKILAAWLLVAGLLVILGWGWHWIFFIPGLLMLLMAGLIFLWWRRRRSSLHKETNKVQPIILDTEKRLEDLEGNNRLTVLLENHKSDSVSGLSSRHGLSLLLEREEGDYLLDVGPDETAFNNARILSKDLSKIKKVFVSHGHYDHGGGLHYFLKNNQQAEVYISERVQKEKYFASAAGTVKRDISIDAAGWEEYPQRFIFVKEFMDIGNGMYLIPRVGKKEEIPTQNLTLYKYSEGDLVRDDFIHEQILVIKEEEGLIVYSGCCHSGVLNVIFSVKEYFPDEKIKAVIGGFHLYNPIKVQLGEKPEDVTLLGKKMAEMEVERYLTGHCTGVEAYLLLKEILGDRLEYIYTGASFNL